MEVNISYKRQHNTIFDNDSDLLNRCILTINMNTQQRANQKNPKKNKSLTFLHNIAFNV